MRLLLIIIIVIISSSCCHLIQARAFCSDLTFRVARTLIMRVFTYRHPGRADALLLLMPPLDGEVGKVMFIAGPDYHYNASPWHGSNMLQRATDTLQHCHVKFRYFSPNDWEHELTFEQASPGGVWRCITAGYPDIMLHERLEGTMAITNAEPSFAELASREWGAPITTADAAIAATAASSSEQTWIARPRQLQPRHSPYTRSRTPPPQPRHKPSTRMSTPPTPPSTPPTPPPADWVD